MKNVIAVVVMQEFPSPYGVLFILIGNYFRTYKEAEEVLKFPSPYGVLFILISDYETLRKRLDNLVSVSLRSIIHSYPMVKKVFYCNNFLECYRMIFLFLNFFCLFQLKASLTPLFLNIV